MNYEIDLRPPQKISKHRKFSPSTFLFILFLVILLMLMGLYILLEISRDNLLNQVENLETKLARLDSDAVPLILLKEEILEINRKINLESKLAARDEPFSFIFRQMRALSPSDLHLTDITVSRNGYLEIFGYCYGMQTAADYLQSLEKSSMIYNSDLAILNMTESSKFSFSITGTINQGDHIYDNENQ